MARERDEEMSRLRTEADAFRVVAAVMLIASITFGVLELMNVIHI